MFSSFVMQVRPYKTEGGEELLILQEGIRSPAEVFRCSSQILSTGVCVRGEIGQSLKGSPKNWFWPCVHEQL